MNEKFIVKAGKIIEGKAGLGMDAYCVLALIDHEGYPTASTLSIAKADGINWITFGTGLDSNKANRIKNCNKASVCITSASYNITLVGTVEVLTDLETKKDMWYEGMEYHFTGPDDPSYCVIRFKTIRYNLLVGDDEVSGNL